MRRLPVYLLLDQSSSMLGEPIEAVNNGAQLFVSTLRQDPYALETVHISIIGFADKATRLVPLTELASFQLPSIAARGMTSLGAALTLLAESIETDLQKTTADAKGDWKPLVFILTDGRPTDDWRVGLERLKKVRTGMIVACLAGQDADPETDRDVAEVLLAITPSVLKLDTADSNAIKAFFKWVTASVATGSQKVDAGQKEVMGLADLPPPPAEVNVVI